MMGTAARSAAPPWAITLWCDNSNVYAEFLALSGPPLVIKKPKTNAGFAALLEFANSRFKADQPKGGYYQIPSMIVPKMPQGAKGKAKEQVGTSKSREEAHLILKKLGMLK